MKTSDNLIKGKLKNKLLKLHDETLNWLDELQFIRDEQIFLEHLLSSHFIDLSTEKLYDSTRKMIRKLKDVEKRTDELTDIIHVYHKQLATYIESLPANSSTAISKEHKKLRKEFETFRLNFKYVKKKIFGMIKEIMKNHKQKLLLHS